MAEIESGFQQWQKPTLIVWGPADPWLPLNMAQNFARFLPQAELVKLESGGHYPQEHWHEAVIEDLVPFLRRKGV